MKQTWQKWSLRGYHSKLYQISPTPSKMATVTKTRKIFNGPVQSYLELTETAQILTMGEFKK